MQFPPCADDERKKKKEKNAASNGDCTETGMCFYNRSLLQHGTSGWAGLNITVFPEN